MDTLDTLVLVQVVFRHGLRAPDHLTSYPGDPYKDVEFKPFGRGQLTKEGRKQCYDFGKELRQRYHKLLPEDYDDSILEAHSSEVTRARTSLQLVLAGLFPPTEITKVSDLNWQPIQFNYLPLHQDPLIGSIVMLMVNNVNHSGFNKSKNSIEVINHVEENLKWKITKNSQLIMIYDIILSQVHLGYDVPDWAVDIFPKKLEMEAREFVLENLNRPGHLKKGSGGLISKIIKDMEEKSHNLNDMKKKIILYSGHDINVFGLMRVLQFPEVIWPLYTGSISFELHKINDEFYVKVIFIDGYVTESQKDDRIPKLLKVPNTERENWTLAELKQHVGEYL